MPIDIDGQTIWVECVESQKGSGDAIVMEVGDTEGIFYYLELTIKQEKLVFAKISSLLLLLPLLQNVFCFLILVEFFSNSMGKGFILKDRLNIKEFIIVPSSVFTLKKNLLLYSPFPRIFK